MNSCEKEFTFDDLKNAYKNKKGFGCDESSFWVEYTPVGKTQDIYISFDGYVGILNMLKQCEVIVTPEGTSFNRINYILNALMGE